MRKPIVFCEVENYVNAYLCRLSDLGTLKSANRKAMTMHLGGVVLECFLKDIIIKDKKIIKTDPKEGKFWYNSEVLEELQLTIDSSDDQIKDKTFRCGFQNPGHDLIEAFLSIDALRENRTEEIDKKLKVINYPIDGKSFINLRYYSEENVSDETFKEWYRNFIECKYWIENMIQMEVNSDE